MNNRRLREITARAALYGLAVEYNRPGDGVRRYYFVLPNGRHDGAGDLQLSGPHKGPDLASAWLDGFACRDYHSKTPCRKD